MSLTEDIDSFTITKRSEICFYLQQLANESEKMTVSFGGGNESSLTLLLSINAEKGLLIFDCSGSKEANQKLLKADHILFVASPKGVRHKFTVSQLTQVTYKGHPAFSCKLPDSLVRMQRREYFRMSLPLTQRPPCRFTHGENNLEWLMSVVDISIGGVAVEAAMSVSPFTLGEIIKKATIDMGKAFAVLEVNLEVRFAGIVTRGKHEYCRLGCCFIKLHSSHENMLQRFITKEQQEERARLG